MNTSLKDRVTAWAFMAPALVVLGVFGLFPIGYAFFVSLHHWRVKRGAFLGFEHYSRALGDPLYVALLVLGLALFCAVRRWPIRRSQRLGLRVARRGLEAATLAAAFAGLLGIVGGGDARLFNAFKVTAFYAVCAIPAEVVISMVLAYLLFKAKWAKGFFRVLFFLPYVTPMIATAVAFRIIFSPHPSSLANQIGGAFGLQTLGWLFESRSVASLALHALDITQYPGWIDEVFPSLALISVVLYNIWVYIGYDTVILLAGLSAIPPHYYEAAAIDGATAMQSFRHITLPLISPSLFFISLVAVIGTFKAFNHIYIMRTAGARDTVDVVSIAIFDQIYLYHNLGYAASLSLILFVVILALTFVQNRVLGRRVFYGE